MVGRTKVADHGDGGMALSCKHEPMPTGTPVCTDAYAHTIAQVCKLVVEYGHVLKHSDTEGSYAKANA